MLRLDQLIRLRYELGRCTEDAFVVASEECYDGVLGVFVGMTFGSYDIVLVDCIDGPTTPMKRALYSRMIIVGTVWAHQPGYKAVFDRMDPSTACFYTYIS